MSLKTMDVVREAFRLQTWPVYCIRRGCRHDARMVGSIVNNNFSKLTCSICGFSIEIPLDWYRLSSSMTLGHLLSTVPGIDEVDARSWINNTKYTHPTYCVSQKLERDAAKKSFQYVIKKSLGDQKGSMNVLGVGANNCLEFEYFPFNWNQEKSIAVDIADGALRMAKRKYSKMRFVCEFAESLSKNSLDLEQKKLGDECYESIDVCLALRIFQSSRFQIWSALVRIRDLMKPGGLLLISIPRKTVLALGNIHPGIYHSSGKFDESGPKKVVEMIAHEMASGPGMFSDITLYYGAPDDMEYYITARRSG